MFIKHGPPTLVNLSFCVAFFVDSARTNWKMMSFEVIATFHPFTTI